MYGPVRVPVHYGGNVNVSQLRDMGVPVTPAGPAQSFNSIEAQTRQAHVNGQKAIEAAQAAPPVVATPNPFDYADDPSGYDAAVEHSIVTNNFGGEDLTAGYDGGTGAGLATTSPTDYFNTDRFPNLTLEEAGILQDFDQNFSDGINLEQMTELGLIKTNEDGTLNAADANRAITALEVYMNDTPGMTQEEKNAIQNFRLNVIEQIDGEYKYGPLNEGNYYDFTTNAEKRAWLEENGVAIPENKIIRAEQAAADGVQYNQGAVGFYKPANTFANKFDNFTDGVSDFASTILSPIDWVADTVGGGFKAIGSGIGDNVVGRGVSNFGGWLDRTGDYITEDLPDRIINYPDNLVNMGQGVYQMASGDKPGGQPVGWDLVKSGGKGLITDVGDGIRDAVGVGADLAKNVFGVDDIKFSFGVGAGGGTQRGVNSAPARPGTARAKSRVMNSRGRSSGGSGSFGGGAGSGSGGNGVVRVGNESYNLNTSEGQAAYQQKYGKANLEGHLKRMESNLVGANKAVNEASPFDGETEKSKVKASMVQNQGSPNNPNSWLGTVVPEPSQDNYNSIENKVGTPNVAEKKKEDEDEDDSSPDLFN